MTRNQAEISPRDTQRMAAPPISEQGHLRNEIELERQSLRASLGVRRVDSTYDDEEEEVTQRRAIATANERDTTPGSLELEEDEIDVVIEEDLDKKFDRRGWEQLGPQGTRSPVMGLDPMPGDPIPSDGESHR